MPHYLLAVRHPDTDYLVDEPEGVQLSDDAAGRAFALAAPRLMLRNQSPQVRFRSTSTLPRLLASKYP
jgi:hypothetical protein